MDQILEDEDLVALPEVKLLGCLEGGLWAINGWEGLHDTKFELALRRAAHVLAWAFWTWLYCISYGT